MASDLTQDAKIDHDRVIRLNLQRHQACASRHDLVSSQRDANARQLVGKPRERDAGVPQHVGADTVANRLTKLDQFGNVLATNYMFNIAPKDGTAIATIACNTSRSGRAS